MFKKIMFLFKSNANIKLILLFLLQKITNIFLKKKIKYEKKYFLNLLSNLKVSTEFFSVNAYNFFNHLSSLKDDFKYLEIGSFEGGSAIYISNRFQSSQIFCVDNWVKTEDGYGNLDFSHVEKNFDFNISNCTNIKKIKETSDNFFLINNQYFDAIYIDGYHKGNQVFKDCVNAWKILNIGGILVCDDYIWDHYIKLEENPCFAVNQFLKLIKNFKVLQVSNSQIFIKKT
jgi:predicted O-methyltransferase YrrM